MSNKRIQFCQYCGTKLDAGARFCKGCGERVIEETHIEKKCVGTHNYQKDVSKRNIVFEGNIHKCPNCGEVLNSFLTVCPSCGFEFRDAVASDAITEFVENLNRIENSRKEEKGNGIGKAFIKAFGGNTTDVVDRQLANTIAHFSVPNTQEDVFEFMILAASNIDPIAYDVSTDGYGMVVRQGKMMISNAWDSKYNQVRQKAKLMFPNDPRLEEIEKLYKSKQREIRGKKLKPLIILMPLFLMFIICFLILFLIGA